MVNKSEWYLICVSTRYMSQIHTNMIYTFTHITIHYPHALMNSILVHSWLFWSYLTCQKLLHIAPNCCSWALHMPTKKWWRYAWSTSACISIVQLPSHYLCAIWLFTLCHKRSVNGNFIQNTQKLCKVAWISRNSPFHGWKKLCVSLVHVVHGIVNRISFRWRNHFCTVQLSCNVTGIEGFKKDVVAAS